MQNTVLSPNPLFNRTQNVDWLPYEEFPFKSRFIDIDGNQIHYIDEGQDPILLFVHTPMWLFVFRDIIKVLRSDFRCIALDFPMTGLSKASNTYKPSIPSASLLLEQLIQKLDLNDITLVAHDIGGPISLGAATRMPERFKAIVLNGSFGWSLKKHNKDVACFLAIVSSHIFSSLNAQTNLIIRLTTTSAGIGRHLSKAGKAAFQSAFRQKESRRTLTNMFADVLKQDAYLEELEQNLHSKLSHLPVLLAYGEKDKGRKSGFQERFEGIFPNHTSVSIAGANHFPQMDAPHEVAQTIANWWAMQNLM